ncbi:hypothetical protein J6590_076798 [Homalodisca vitripennis]|nr:hypothetical protein J6590_076798 [Homalodisca vitripennis]
MDDIRVERENALAFPIPESISKYYRRFIFVYLNSKDKTYHQLWECRAAVQLPADTFKFQFPTNYSSPEATTHWHAEYPGLTTEPDTIIVRTWTHVCKAYDVSGGVMIMRALDDSLVTPLCSRPIGSANHSPDNDHGSSLDANRPPANPCTCPLRDLTIPALPPIPSMLPVNVMTDDYFMRCTVIMRPLYTAHS